MEKAFLEITNICNLSCSFCHLTKRTPKQMSKEDFDLLTDKLKGKVKHLYFHLMGEPMTHPMLPEFIEKAKAKGFIPVLTTNGTLLEQLGDELIKAKPFKISISLQSFEGNHGNNAEGLEQYLRTVSEFAKKAAPEIIIVFRLWNLGGKESENDHILEFLRKEFPSEWRENRSGFALADKVFLEFGEAFDWPGEEGTGKGSISTASNEDSGESEFFCYGLRNQIGILVDGTVVPCCLDADGAAALGNLLKEDLDVILNSPRAKAIYDGFSMHTAVEELCKSCGYASKTKKYHGGKQSPYAK